MGHLSETDSFDSSGTHTVGSADQLSKDKHVALYQKLKNSVRGSSKKGFKITSTGKQKHHINLTLARQQFA